MNNNIFYFFYSFSHQSEFFDKFTIFVAETLPYFVILFAIFFLFFHKDTIFSKKFFAPIKRKWKEAMLIFFSGIFAWVLAYILKLLFHTSRPFLVLSDVTPLWVEGGYAFPSGHATFFLALAFAIYFSHKKAGYVFISFAVLIGLARIVAGVHFPVDIFGGFILGGGIAYLVNYLYKRDKNFKILN